MNPEAVSGKPGAAPRRAAPAQSTACRLCIARIPAARRLQRTRRRLSQCTDSRQKFASATWLPTAPLQ